eukprot:1587773-Pleurochrysis_carterae.AAC.1
MRVHDQRRYARSRPASHFKRGHRTHSPRAEARNARLHHTHGLRGAAPAETAALLLEHRFLGHIEGACAANSREGAPQFKPAS